MNKVFSVGTFLFLFSIGLFLSYSVHAQGYTPNTSNLNVNYNINGNNIEITGNYEGGANVYICEIGYPSGYSYAYQISSIGYEIMGSGIGGEPNIVIFRYGYDGPCADYQEWGYQYFTTADISSLPRNQSYTIRVWAINTAGWFDERYIDFYLDGPIYGCTDPAATNYNPNATVNDGSCQYPSPPPGNFTLTSNYCYGWPNPEVETNFNESSNASYYILEKWFGSYYAEIYRGSRQAVDTYGDTNVSSGNTYYYRVIAVNDYGSTYSNEGSFYVNQPNCGGPSTYLLSTSVGSGSGTIAGSGSGWSINCPSGSCNANVPYDTYATITATPSTGYAFSGWSGACSGTSVSTCSLYMNQARTTQALFSANSYQLIVSVSPSGGGTVTGTGINCPGDCSETYTYGTNVVLTRTTSPGYDFSSWSGGGCSGTAVTCTVTMNQAQNVGATFSANLYSITVNPSPSGTGTITGTSPGIGTIINCGSDCGENLTYNTPVTLTASGIGGYSFSSWSGACASQGSTCNLTMDASKSTTANFVADFNYSLSNSGPSNVTKASSNAFTTNIITKTLVAGASQSVSLTLSGVPSGVSYSISSPTCSPTCTSTITFTVAPSAPVGTYPITVTGSPLSKTTNFNLIITGAPFTVSCDGAPDTVYLNETVTWTTTVSGGVSPFTYTWYGSGYPVGGNENVSGNRTEQSTRTYTTIGTKSVYTTVRDADSVTVTCPAATVQVNFDPNFEEF